MTVFLAKLEREVMSKYENIMNYSCHYDGDANYHVL